MSLMTTPTSRPTVVQNLPPDTQAMRLLLAARWEGGWSLVVALRSRTLMVRTIKIIEIDAPVLICQGGDA